MFAYLMQMSKLDNKDIDVASKNIARKAKGLTANVLVLDNVSPILLEIKKLTITNSTEDKTKDNQLMSIE